MPEALQCPGCGADLSADAPEGLCPECLLEEAMRDGPGPGSGSVEAPSTTTPRSPSSAFVPPRPEDLVPHFPQLEVIELLGHGGMGVVYKARQLRLDRLVALKILPPELGGDPAFAERFAREARALARLAHPRIVGVHDFGQSGGLFYLLMEFVDGANLRGLMRQGRLEPEEALRIIPQICEALQYAHEEGVVHRDIKPENILLDRRGNVKIADFGLAKLLGTMTGDSVLTGSRQVMGTLRYVAPEQMERPLEVDHRADIYSLGVVFYEMLTGELPMGLFDPPSKKAGVDPRLDWVVFRALEKEPERRYQHVSDVKTEVEALSIPPGHPADGSSVSSDGAKVGDLKWARVWAAIVFASIAISADTFRRFRYPRDYIDTKAWPYVLAVVFGIWLGTAIRSKTPSGDINRLDTTGSHPASTAERWRQVWLLIPLLCAMAIAALVPPASMSWQIATMLAPIIVLALGIGLWASWQFVRAGRAGDTKTTPAEIPPRKSEATRDFDGP